MNDEVLAKANLKSDDISVIKQLHKGLSQSIKYYIKLNSGDEYLLTTELVYNHEQFLTDCQYLKDLKEAGFPNRILILYDLYNNASRGFKLFQWVHGESLDTVIKAVYSSAAYEIGRRAGSLLKQIHSHAATLNSISKGRSLTDSPCLQDIIDDSILRYHQFKEQGGNCYKGDLLLSILEDFSDSHNLAKYNCKPNHVIHGDFHLGNLILTPNNDIVPIDWKYNKTGNVVDDFIRIQVSAERSRTFCKGQIDGYFNGRPREDFWIELYAKTLAHQLDLLWLPFPNMGNGQPFAAFQHEQFFRIYKYAERCIPAYYANVE